MEFIDDSNNLDKLNSIEKSLYILKTISAHPQGLTIANITKLTKLNRSAVYRSLKPLEDSSMLVKDSTGNYFLGPLVFYLGQTYLKTNVNKEETLAILTEISDLVQESVGLAIRDGDQVISLYEIETSQPLKTNYTAGQFYPMNRGCYGKCLMAFHDEKTVDMLLDNEHFEKICNGTLTTKAEILAEYQKIRKENFVVSVDEISPYIVAVGIPVKNCHGTVMACLSVSFFKKEDYLEKIQQLRILLPKYGAALSPFIL